MSITVIVDPRTGKSAPIHTQSALAAILPPEVAERIDPDLLREPYTAPSLRILATIRDPRIWEYVGECRIDWPGMVASVRGLSSSVQVRVQIAAALAGWPIYSLDAANLAAVVDAVRIAGEGLL